MGLDFAEDMIRLYLSVETALQPEGAYVLQFVGSRPGEGTSTLARAYAKAVVTEFGKRVLLLDADLGQLDAPATNGVREQNGVRPAVPEPQEGKALMELGSTSRASQELVSHDALIDKGLVEPGEEPYFCFPVPASHLSMISAGQSLMMESLFARLRERFDMVVVDSPPVHQSSYSLVIARQADGVVLVVEASRTRWPVARSAKRKIINSGGNVVGLVLNKRRSYIPPFLQQRFS